MNSGFKHEKLILIFLALVSLIGCEIDTRVRVTSDNPPRFTFSGNGILAQLYVSGPFTLDELKLIDGKKVLTKEESEKIRQALGEENRILWQIDPGESSKQVSRLSAIVYGEIPIAFRQVFPKEGTPKPLLEGMYYSVYAPSYDAGDHNTNFLIKSGKAIEVEVKQ